MAEQVMPGPVQDTACIREAVCIHTKKIFDSCRDKDCLEDLRFYPCKSSKPVIDRALSIKPGAAELVHVCVDVEPVCFNHGCYTVDVRYFYRVTADAFVGATRPVCVSGLVVFDKRVILFGSEASAKVFSSDQDQDGEEARGCKSNLPTAVVEAVDPVILCMKLVDNCDCRSSECDTCEVPTCVSSRFEGELSFSSEGKRVYVTLGQFSIIRLERDTQLLIPVYDYCLPEKECVCGCCDDDPCEVFRQVKFPVDEFFPPNCVRGEEDYRELKGCCGK